MNLKNKQTFDELVIEGTRDGAKLPDAYALAIMVERAIKDKSYKVHYADTIETFDIIVTFGLSPDPLFGMYFEDDGDGEEVMAVSTANGIVINYL